MHHPLRLLLVAAAAAFTVGAHAANPACEKQADEKKLAGAARNSFVTKCERDAGGGKAASAGVACEKQADDKKLAGAARNSFVKKCVADAGG